jgi:hypothetical protein
MIAKNTTIGTIGTIPRKTSSPDLGARAVSEIKPMPRKISSPNLGDGAVIYKSVTDTSANEEDYLPGSASPSKNNPKPRSPAENLGLSPRWFTSVNEQGKNEEKVGASTPAMGKDKDDISDAGELDSPVSSRRDMPTVSPSRRLRQIKLFEADLDPQVGNKESLPTNPKLKEDPSWQSNSTDSITPGDSDSRDELIENKVLFNPSQTETSEEVINDLYTNLGKLAEKSAWEQALTRLKAVSPIELDEKTIVIALKLYMHEDERLFFVNVMRNCEQGDITDQRGRSIERKGKITDHLIRIRYRAYWVQSWLKYYGIDYFPKGEAKGFIFSLGAHGISAPHKDFFIGIADDPELTDALSRGYKRSNSNCILF